MKRYGRYICGVLTIAALLGTNASGPVPVAWAAEQSGQDALRQDGVLKIGRASCRERV